MKLFDVYPINDITIVRAKGSHVWDDQGNQYLDMYGGHAVISIGHTHPHYVQRITDQLNKVGFYSNSIRIPMQQELADKLGKISGKSDFQLFLCNSGAEANENAMKLASFHTGRRKIVAFRKGFHGRTSLAVAATDNPNIVAPVNETDNIIFLPFNDQQALEDCFRVHGSEIAGVIIEGIQGVGGINIATENFLQKIFRNNVFIQKTFRNGSFLDKILGNTSFIQNLSKDDSYALEWIKSITFYDSIAVIHKQKQPKKTKYNDIISGKIEPVTDGIFIKKDKNIK